MEDGEDGPGGLYTRTLTSHRFRKSLKNLGTIETFCVFFLIKFSLKFYFAS